MPEIHYKKLEEYISCKKNEPFKPVYLLHGEEFIYRSAAKELIKAILPDYMKSINFESVDGSNGNIQEAIDKINTFSLLSGTKVVAVFDLPLFYSKNSEKNILEKAKRAYDDNDIKKAAGYIKRIASILNISSEDMKTGKTDKILNTGRKLYEDTTWLVKSIEFCNDLQPPDFVIKDKDIALKTAVEKGFPEKNHLIITTDLVDKRRSLYRIIKKRGMVVDCSVQKGFRAKDKTDQESVLYDIMLKILAKTGKKIDKQTFVAIYDLTGFDIRTFSNSIEKLVNYSGDSKHISIDDVKRLLKRTKQDPLYEFTGAVAQRELEKAVFYLNSILSGGQIDHPLQLLAAMINQFRKLMVIKDFAESPYGKNWRPNFRYNEFKSYTLPAIIQYDQDVARLAETCEHTVEKDDARSDSKKNKEKRFIGKKKNISIKGFLIAKNPNNSYPIYRMLQQSEKFKKNELNYFFILFEKADKMIKTTGQNPKLILENLVIKICSKVM